MENNCLICGKVVHVCAAHEAKGFGKFCSRSCAAKSHTGDKNPNWKGGVSQVNYVYKLRQKERYPERVKARDMVSKAIRDGGIKKGTCEVCGTNENIQGHHDNYDEPLNVRWLCKKHHRELHGNKKAA